MRRLTSAKCLIAACSAVFLGSANARAAVIIATASSTTSHAAFDGSISATDGIENGSAYVASTTFTAPSVGTTGARMTDGVGSPLDPDNGSGVANDLYYDGTANFGPNPNQLLNNPTAVFNLNLGAGGSATGYDLSSINSFYGWVDHRSFSDQSYTVSVSYVSNPSSFNNLYTVLYAPFDPANDASSNQRGATEVSLADSSGGAITNGLVSATGIAGLKFTFTAYNNGTVNQAGQLIREVDATVTPTAVPEPTSLGLIGALSALSLGRGRRTSNR